MLASELLRKNAAKAFDKTLAPTMQGQVVTLLAAIAEGLAGLLELEERHPAPLTEMWGGK